MKDLKNLGKALTKAEQKTINGGWIKFCQCDSDCGIGVHCCSNRCISPSAPNYPVGNCPPMVCPM